MGLIFSLFQVEEFKPIQILFESEDAVLHINFSLKLHLSKRNLNLVTVFIEIAHASLDIIHSNSFFEKSVEPLFDSLVHKAVSHDSDLVSNAPSQGVLVSSKGVISILLQETGFVRKVHSH